MESTLSLIALLSMSAIAPSVTPMAQSGSATNAALPEVVIQSTEPRYVAPTRHDRIGRIWAPVMIDGKGPFRLVLDTGATHSVVTSDVASALGVNPGDRGEVQLRGVTGVARVPTIPVRTLEVGDLLIEPATLPIIADAMGGADGILGNEGLMDKRIVIEFQRDRITIAHSRRQHASQGFTTLQVHFGVDGLLMVDAHVGLIRTAAVIDTGAQRTLGNLALQRALGDQRRRDVKLSQVFGATQVEQDGASLSSPGITLGSATIEGANIVYGDYSIFEHWGLANKPALIIGMDVLGLLDTLVIDYERREVQMLCDSKTLH
jgi:predicted aspartyl protease